MDYKDLSASEKIEQVREYRAYREERPYLAVYLKALRRNDQRTIDEYESFGDNPRQIIMNRRAYDQQQKFGFTGKTLNEYGWLENADFTDVERIEFIDRKGWAAFNYITIGQGVNGKWSYGASYSTGGELRSQLFDRWIGWRLRAGDMGKDFQQSERVPHSRFAGVVKPPCRTTGTPQKRPCQF